MGFPDSSDGKESAFYAGDPGLILGWEDTLEKGMATLPGKSHGQRSLAGCMVHRVAKSQTQLSD